MQVILLKKYKPHSRELKVGTEMGVTNEVGEELIAKGIARDVTKEYNANILANREENNGGIDEISKDNPKPKKEKKNN